MPPTCAFDPLMTVLVVQVLVGHRGLLAFSELV